MPEVDAVAALADLDERGPREDRPEPRRRRVDGDEHGDQRQQRDEGEQPLVHVAVGERRHRGDAPSIATASRPRPSSSQPPRERRRCRRPPRPPHERRRRAEQQAGRPGHRRQVHEVDAVDVVEHGDRRAELPGPLPWSTYVHTITAAETATSSPRCPARGQPGAAEGDERERPEQVPLLLDGEAPDVAQQRRIAAVVRDARRGSGPSCRRRRSPTAGRAAAATAARRCRRTIAHTATAASTVNRAGSRRRARRIQNCGRLVWPELVALVEQQRRDEEAGHDEEHLDAEEPAVHPREPGVVEDHGDHRQRAQAVERRLVAHRRHRRHPRGWAHGSSIWAASAADLGCRRLRFPDRSPPRRVAVSGRGRGPGGRRAAQPFERRVVANRLGHRRTMVPLAVVSTIQPSACRAARTSSAAA